MLRLFWPYSDSTRLTSDVDAVPPYNTDLQYDFPNGRFTDTKGVRARYDPAPLTYYTLPFGFLRTVGATIRVAFDYYHVNAGSTVSLLTIRSTSTTTTYSSSTHTSINDTTTLLTIAANTSSGKITAQLANSSVRTGNDNLSNNEWHRIEIEYTPSNTVGVLKVYVNDVEQAGITMSAADTILGTAVVTSDLWFQFGTATANGAYSSNLMIWDDSGTTDDLTGFLGDVTPIKRVPTSDHDVDGTPSTPGNNYSMVADNAGTNYVTFENDGDFDLYGYAALGVTGTVKAVVVVAEGFLVGNGEARLKAVAKHTATVDESTVQSGTLTTYVAPRNVLQAAFVNVPNGTGWTVGQVDAAYFGVKGVIN